MKNENVGEAFAVSMRKCLLTSSTVRPSQSKKTAVHGVLEHVTLVGVHSHPRCLFFVFKQQLRLGDEFTAEVAAGQHQTVLHAEGAQVASDVERDIVVSLDVTSAELI
jgi:hypothetical protein